MNCKEVKKLMGAYIFGDLEPQDMKLVRLHAKDCPVCYQDLISRTEVSINLGASTPTLSDEDKLMIVRGVRNRIQIDETSNIGVFSKLIPALGLCGLMVIGFGLGKLIAQKPIIQKPAGIAISHPNKTIMPMPPINSAQSLHNTKPSVNILDKVKDKIGESAVNNIDNNRALGITNRGGSNGHKAQTIILDEPLPVVEEPIQQEPLQNKSIEQNQSNTEQTTGEKIDQNANQ